MTPKQLDSIQTFAADFSGKLLLKSEIQMDNDVFQELLDSHCFTPVKSIIRKPIGYACNRCGNRKQSLFGILPSINNPKKHYCRKCIEMGRVLESEPLYQWTGPDFKWPKHNSPCTWTGNLTMGQQKASERIITAIETGEKELLVWAVCGAGKTEMLYPGISTALKAGKRICLATPRVDVVRELLPRIQQAFRHVPVQALYGGSPDKIGSAQLLLATTHQLLRYKHAFDLLVIDEVDAFPFHADPMLPYAASRARKPDGSVIFLTATPRKTHHLQMSRKKLPYIFVPVRFHGYPLPVPVCSLCYALKKDLRSGKLPQTFMHWLKQRKNSDRQLLIFVPAIKLAMELTEELINCPQLIDHAQTSIESVHAQDTERADKVERFRKKEIMIMVTTTILERGVTFPSVDVAVLDAGHSVFDMAALVQIAGRAGRSPDDPFGEVMFFHDGKTDAMLGAVKSIQAMNKRGGMF